MTKTRKAEAIAHPSLALIKYWGKADTELNLPAVPSLALTLGDLTTHTVVEYRRTASRDRVFIHGAEQAPERFNAFFRTLRKTAQNHGAEDVSGAFTVRSQSNFPTAAGLASSASGFAALTAAGFAALGVEVPKGPQSATARIGSASAARSIWGGFVRLDAGADRARPVHDEKWWPELRVVVARTESGPKSLPSRQAMELSRSTSPYYPSWRDDAENLMQAALIALEQRNLNELGPLMRMSYLRMFATMFSSNPPVLYWNPTSVKIIRLCEQIRDEGLQVWETMDAGPQVKLFCLESETEQIMNRLKRNAPEAEYFCCAAGGGAEAVD